jgi:hypothetical protein
MQNSTSRNSESVTVNRACKVQLPVTAKIKRLVPRDGGSILPVCTIPSLSTTLHPLLSLFGSSSSSGRGSIVVVIVVVLVDVIVLQHSKTATSMVVSLDLGI